MCIECIDGKLIYGFGVDFVDMCVGKIEILYFKNKNICVYYFILYIIKFML